MNIRAILMGLAFSLIWSSAFTSARIIVEDASPLMTLAARYLISGLIGVGIAAALGQSLRLTRTQWTATIIFGLCQNFLYLGLNFTAMQTVQASLAAVIASCLPLTVALVGILFLRERWSWLTLIGLTLGVIGVLTIMSARVDGGFDLFGLVLCVLGLMALTAATLLVKTATSGGNLIMIVGLQMLAAVLPLAIASLLTEDLRLNVTPPFVIAFAYTTLFPGLIATFIWFALVRQIGAVRAATFHFLNPFFGVTVAAFVLAEPLGLRDLLGVMVIMAGIVAVQRG